MHLLAVLFAGPFERFWHEVVLCRQARILGRCYYDRLDRNVLAHLVPCPVDKLPLGQMEEQPRRTTTWCHYPFLPTLNDARTTRATRQLLITFELKPGLD